MNFLAFLQEYNLIVNNLKKYTTYLNEFLKKQSKIFKNVGDVYSCIRLNVLYIRKALRIGHNFFLIVTTRK